MANEDSLQEKINHLQERITALEKQIQEQLFTPEEIRKLRGLSDLWHGPSR